MATTYPGGFTITKKGVPVDANGVPLSAAQLAKIATKLKIKIPKPVREKATTNGDAAASAPESSPATEALEKLTRDQLKAILDAGEVEYDDKAKHADLLALVLVNPDALLAALTPVKEDAKQEGGTKEASGEGGK